jgi:hypothetical protein
LCFYQVRPSITTGSIAGHTIEKENLSLKKSEVSKSSWTGSEVPPFVTYLTSDANLFLRENPWPDRYNSSFSTEVAPKKTSWTSMCLKGATGDDLEAQNDAPQSSNPTQDPSPRFQWTEALQQNFREELEKLVILDYMMRNTGSTLHCNISL